LFLLGNWAEKCAYFISSPCAFLPGHFIFLTFLKISLCRYIFLEIFIQYFVISFLYGTLFPGWAVGCIHCFPFLLVRMLQFCTQYRELVITMLICFHSQRKSRKFEKFQLLLNIACQFNSQTYAPIFNFVEELLPSYETQKLIFIKTNGRLARQLSICPRVIRVWCILKSRKLMPSRVSNITCIKTYYNSKLNRLFFQLEKGKAFTLIKILTH
jgi:hypothetical protein